MYDGNPGEIDFGSSYRESTVLSSVNKQDYNILNQNGSFIIIRREVVANRYLIFRLRHQNPAPFFGLLVAKFSPEFSSTRKGVLTIK